jgi:uncharacterized membrane protein
MTWLQRYRVRHYVRNSMWLIPVLALAAALIAVRLIFGLDRALGLETSLSPDAARTLLSTLAGALFTFIVFVCSTLILVVQLASAQLSPRVIGILFRDQVTKWTLAYFVFTFTFVLSGLVRIDAAVPFLITNLAAYLCVASVAAFLILVDHVGKMLRPTGVFSNIASRAHRVIDIVYPQRFGGGKPSGPRADTVTVGPARTVNSLKGGVVLAFDAAGLAALGSAHDSLIELVPQVGDFVAPGDPLFRVRGGNVSEASLHQSIALGAERTIEQDPAFGFRMIVDIASKGLSPAINDPTTAVLAVDRIHHLLRHVGNRCLDNATICDATGRVRLLYRTPDWEDFVSLAVTEIRHFGGSSIQIARRLRAMLDDLIATLPAERSGILRQELKKLKKSAQRFFQDPEDQALADISDAQGVGGAGDSGKSGSGPETEAGDGAPRPSSAADEGAIKGRDAGPEVHTGM